MSSVLQILGGLGVFLFGLRIMSGGLQKFAGNRLRAVLHTMTHNRVTGVLSGFMITAAAQSSSATTVLIVSFANAGLLSLIQAIGLIMGANIGTTVTGWLVSLLGFKVKITAFALPIIGIGFPLSLLKNQRARHLSEIMVGFGLLFLGLKFLKDGVPDLKSNPEALAWLQQFTDYGIGSVLLFVLVGSIITVIVQSSSAAMTITLAMAAEGWITFDIAAAMVLGENIGTTITATLAAIGANRNAKRVARSHTLFNLIGVLWIIPLLGVVLGLVDSIVPGDPNTDPLATPLHLAAFHTIFNISNTFLLIWFVKHIAALVYRLVPLTDDEREQSHLKLMDSGLIGTPELADVEARRALHAMTGVCKDTFAQARKAIVNSQQAPHKQVEEVKRGEIVTDQMEEELVEYCVEVVRSDISRDLSRNIAAYLEVADDLESIGDYCLKLALLAERSFEKKYVLDSAIKDDVDKMLALVEKLLKLADSSIEPDGDVRSADAQSIADEILALRDDNRKRHAKRMQDSEIDIRTGLLYLDFMAHLHRVGRLCVSIVHQLDHQATSEEEE